ncbi:MAG: phosphoenolpyruvate synthase, partial [Clostridiales bacterium]|nr:phosphoenolpyruvate synthase [Clostridiales bacterium]
MKIIDISNFEQGAVAPKARNLFIMKKNGINVPNLIYVSLEGGVLDKEKLLGHIKATFPDTKYFSVRSSCSLEDGIGYSFAGLFDTYLNLTLNQVPGYAMKCLAGLGNQNVEKYCLENNIPLGRLVMGIIIQEMVMPQLSGVIFTANPQGLLNEIVTICGEGTGDGAVSGSVPVTTYYYSKTDKIYYYETQPNSPILGGGLFSRLMHVAIGLEKILGGYLDIEYAIQGNEIFILQARPITTLDTENIITLDNSNIVESYPGITLPLTTSFIGTAYYNVFKGSAMRILKNKKLVGQYGPILENMTASSNGRVYYNINNWYEILKCLPFSKKIIPIWQEMLGVSEKAYNGQKSAIPKTQKIKSYFNFFYEFFNVPKNMKKLNENFIVVENLYKQNKNLSNAGLIELYWAISEKVLCAWDITLLNDMYAFIFTGLLKKVLAKTFSDTIGLDTYISGISNIESIKPIKGLASLAADVLNSPQLKSGLSGIKNDESALEYIMQGNSSFAKKLKDYIEIYGDRSLEELKLESLTFKSSPYMLVEKILEYAKAPDKLELIGTVTEKNKNIKLPGNTGLLNKILIKAFSKRAMLGIKNREISRLNRSRIYGMVRSIFLAIGENFYKSGLINNKRDIFYLEIGEVFGHINGHNYNFKQLIE